MRRLSRSAGSLCVAVALTIVAAASALAQQESPPEGGTPRDFRLPETRSFDLPNGMEVTLAPYGTLPEVEVQLVVRAGNADEDAGEVWLADLTGDLMMEGTTARTGREIALAAAAMGGGVDVSVGPDETTVGGEVLSDFAADFVRLVADIVRNPVFPETEIDRLKADLVRRVTIARTQPQQLAFEKFREVLYPDHPYGRVFPTPEAIQGYTVDQARGFHAAHFGADRARLYVSGLFDDAAVEAAIREAFGDWASATAPAPPVPSPSSEREIHLIDRPGAVQSTVYLGLPVLDPSHPDYIELQVTNTLLGGSFHSRITSNIREEKGYTYSPFSQVSTRFRDAYWVEAADVTTDVTGASLEEIFKEIDELQAAPPTQEELRGFQNYLAGTFVLQNSSPAGIIGALRFIDLHGLDRSYLTEYVRNVHAVTPEDVRRIATEALDDERMTIVIAGDVATIREQVAPFGEIAGEGTQELEVE